MSTASPEVRTSAPRIRQALRELELENRLRIEQLRADRLSFAERREFRRRNRLEALSIDWVTPYAELLDLTRRTGDPIFTGPSSFWQRREGRNWPIYQTEVELAILRAPARLLVATSTYTQGLVHGLGSYIISTGFNYRIANRAKEKDKQAPKEVLAALQAVVDALLERNGWHDAAQPGLEMELFERSLEDGEALLVSHPREDGWTDWRSAEPEQLTQPPEADFQDFGFGVLTPPNDAQRIQGYYLQYGETPVEGQYYEPDEILHLKRNVRRGMKRGMTDFCFNMYDNLNLAQRLLTNKGDASAQQAAIVYVREHENGSQEDVQSFIDGESDYNEFQPITGNQVDVKVYRRGEREDIPKGMKYVNGPMTDGTDHHLAVLACLTRGCAQRYNAPEWLASSDASNNNYSSSLTAESPFVISVKREQKRYTNAYRQPIVRALKHYVETRGFFAAGRRWTWEELWRQVDLVVTANSPEVRDTLQEAQQAQVEIPLGVQSRQGYMAEQNRDADQIEADNQEWQDRFGGGGSELPVPPEEGGGANPALSEALLESALLEHGFTGDLTDKAGHKRHYVDGKEVAAPTARETPAGDHPAAKLIASAIEASDLSAETKTAYHAALAQVFKRIPPTGLSRIAACTKGAKFYSDAKALGLSVVENELAKTDLHPDRRKKMEAVKVLVESGQATIAGAYSPDTWTLHLDGGQKASGNQAGPHGGSKEPHEVWAHELGHALDGPQYQISKSARWLEVWNKEIGPDARADDGGPRLNRYAQEKPAEGLAEFTRLVYGGKTDRERVAREFPLATKYFQDAKLWPS